MRIEKITYNRTGYQRLFYVAKNLDILHPPIKAIVYTAQSGKKEVEFRHLEFEVWDLGFIFKDPGKYCFIVFEDGLRETILIVTIIN